MLALSSVSKNFAGLQVLDNINLVIPENGIFGLIGPNGAGKTTVFNLITGLVVPTSGKIEFFGARVDGIAPYRVTRAGIARTFQNIRVFKEMTVLENVLVAATDHDNQSMLNVLLPLPASRRGEERQRQAARGLLARVGLADKATLLAGTLSYGEQRRLEIARALATGPRLLLLDEPAAGMNTVEKQQLMEEIIKLSDDGLGVFIIEHDMRFIMGLCKNLAVLNFGRLIAQGTPDQIRENPEVVEAYLGRDDVPKPEFPS